MAQGDSKILVWKGRVMVSHPTQYDSGGPAGMDEGGMGCVGLDRGPEEIAPWVTTDSLCRSETRSLPNS